MKKVSEDTIKKCIDDSFDQVKIPEGMEERLIKKIDSFPQIVEDKGGKKLIFRLFNSYASIAVAASIIVAASITLTLLLKTKETQTGLAVDTCRSVEEVYSETERALTMISDAISIGVDKVDNSRNSIAKSVNTLDRYINFENEEK